MGIQDAVNAMAEEINEEKKSARDLFLFKYLLEKSTEPFHVISPAAGFRFIFGNEAACRHFGRSREELLSMSIPDWDPQFTRKRCEETLAQLRVKRSITIESRHRLADGREVPVELWINLIDFQGEELLAGWFHDISERKEREEKLRHKERQFRQLAEALPQLVWISSGDGTVEYYNTRCYEFSCFAPEDLKGDRWARLLHADDYQRTLDRWQYSVRTGEPYEIEYRLRRGSDGAYRWFLTRALPMRSETGEITRWFGTCTDIEPQKQAEEELRRTLDELTRSNKELEQFAYVASHDLQEPLRMVASYVQVLAEKYQGRLDEKADKYIRYACEGAVRMQQLIDDLLAFSRIGRSATFLPVDMNTVFAAVIGELAPGIAESGAEVTSDILPTVTGDREQLEQLLTNLIENAVKYRQPEQPLRIHVGTRRMDGEWEFSVRDNGIGIEPHYFGKIFLIFQRLHSREDYSGTGIGLAMSKKIIERHHGRIWVESHLGEGATFYFTIPADAANQHAVNAEISSTPASHR